MIENLFYYLGAGIVSGFCITLLPWSISMIIRVVLKIFNN